eukprot:3479249-Prymnesium_polylepis.1
MTRWQWRGNAGPLDGPNTPASTLAFGCTPRPGSLGSGRRRCTCLAQTRRGVPPRLHHTRWGTRVPCTPWGSQKTPQTDMDPLHLDRDGGNEAASIGNRTPSRRTGPRQGACLLRPSHDARCLDVAPPLEERALTTTKLGAAEAHVLRGERQRDGSIAADALTCDLTRRMRRRKPSSSRSCSGREYLRSPWRTAASARRRRTHPAAQTPRAWTWCAAGSCPRRLRHGKQPATKASRRTGHAQRPAPAH